MEPSPAFMATIPAWINSPALYAQMCMPRSLPDPASATVFTSPRISPITLARPIRSARWRPTWMVWPASSASRSVRPTNATQGP